MALNVLLVPKPAPHLLFAIFKRLGIAGGKKTQAITEGKMEQIKFCLERSWV